MAGDNWELPKPVFRTSEGSDAAARPVSAAKAPIVAGSDISTPEVQENLSTLYAPPEEVASDVGVAPPIVEIDEQPAISEQLTAERIVPVLPPSAKPVKKSGSSFMVILLAVFAMLAVLLLAVIYVLFIRQPADTTF